MQGSTFEDPFEPVTTTATEISNQTVGRINVSLPLPGGADVYVQRAVAVIAFVGTAANGLILYALLASKQHKKHPLIFNQNLLDFVSCFFLAVMTSVHLSDVYLSGTSGYWLCLLLLNDGCSWGPFLGSLINLAAITIERYMKVVHSVWTKKKLRNWMIYMAMAFAWIGGSVTAAVVMIHTTRVVNGNCFAIFWKSHSGRMAFGIWYFLSFYVVILTILFCCYGRILMVARLQTSVMVAHSGPGSMTTAQIQSNKIQISIIKTMMLVSLLFVVTYTPIFVQILIRNVSLKPIPRTNALLAAMFMGYLYNCINPFIYATKFDPVKRVLLHLIPCKKTTQPGESAGMT